MALAALGLGAGLALAALALGAGLVLAALALGAGLGTGALLGDVLSNTVNKKFYLDLNLPCCLGFLWLLWLEKKIPFGPRFC